MTPSFTQTFTTTIGSSSTATVRAMFAGYAQASAPTSVIYVATGEASTGTAVPVTDQVGGMFPASTDGPAGGSGTRVEVRFPWP